MRRSQWHLAALSDSCLGALDDENLASGFRLWAHRPPSPHPPKKTPRVCVCVCVCVYIYIHIYTKVCIYIHNM